MLTWQAEQHSAKSCATHKVELFLTLSMFWHTCQEGYDCCAAPYCCDHERAAQSADGKIHNMCSIDLAPRFAALWANACIAQFLCIQSAKVP